ncbi:damage-control phosphatase ARMT1 isoform X2 [Halyomorpha halys]|uniref:damage-control phosphatase ARMT1 isoform X2 n=1 Tax=Halyomorpha halys TaxID=286706 RepID=UPI0006D4D7C6|nr:protein-glutamate O-methyltransferase-like isoform X1 [Halyomorpha halys]
MSSSDSLQENSETLMNIVLDLPTPRNEKLSAKYKRSFAYPTVKDRLPVILSKLVDLLYREKQNIINNYGEDAEEELKSAIGEISQLKNHVQTAKPFEKFSSSDPDTHLWNAHLEELMKEGSTLNYFEAVWLVAECYLYRKMREIFATKSSLNLMDYFCYQKSVLLSDSLPAIGPVLSHMEKEGLLNSSKSLSKTQMQEELTMLLKCSLWANRLDLSLAGGTTEVQSDLLHQVEHWDGNILANDLQQVSSLLIAAKTSNKIVDFVTDNSGLEFLCDLCLADYLVSKCNVKQLNFRVKSIPWFISDVMSKDLFQTIEDVRSSPNPMYQKFGERWQKFIDEGVWQVKVDLYWCLGKTYSEMIDSDPQLYNELCSSSLIIFKGDLNYRKLLQEINWDPTTPFSKAIGNFHPAPLVTMRTCKADLICGLEKDLDNVMNAQHDDWLVSGDFAVVQLYSP